MPPTPPSGRGARLRVALLLLAATGFACSGSGSAHATPRPSSVAATPTPAGPAKPAVSGLIDRNGLPPAAFAGAVDGFVANVAWSQLQPQQGGPIAAGNPIDQAIADARSWNAAHPSQQLFVKLRVFAGIDAPDWAKSLGGAPVPVRDPASGQGGTVGRFWTSEFGSAYQDLESKLAAMYDSVPEIREVTISRCTTVFDEPFIRQASDPVTVAALLDAGYTAAADIECLKEEIDAHKAWLRTRSGLALNPFRRIDGTRPASDELVTDTVAQYCRAVLGRRCVLENNSLRYPTLSAEYDTMYATMRSLGPPLSFQTASASRVGSLSQTIQLAAALGANAVELPAGYGAMAATQLLPLDRSLTANPGAS